MKRKYITPAVKTLSVLDDAELMDGSAFGVNNRFVDSEQLSAEGYYDNQEAEGDAPSTYCAWDD